MNKPFEGWKVKDVLAFSAVSRAQTGFCFISRCLDNPPHGTLRIEAVSPPYSRQISILIAYNFELILDSLLFMSSLSNLEDDLIEEAKTRHRLDLLWNKIKDTNTNDLFGIKNIGLKNKNIFIFYEVEFEDGRSVIVHDLNNIRYDLNDFRGQEAVKLRPSVSDEENIVKAVVIFEKLAKSTIEHVSNKYSGK
jgi:hypothetical protein